MNDILGPLPDIPVSNGDCSCTRLSIRRSSGCSGIYEEILDPTAADVYVSIQPSLFDGEKKHSFKNKYFITFYS